ncbi:hypothetical protein C1646_747295 [Rhizophagus diaphanus]|nr:hypothetical protein C1646_747295 [Rhizophagus diaphanus] [Rhizophagus sp. MUCL 43196]
MSNKQKKNMKTLKASKASVHESEISVGTELLREKVSQGTKKVFSQMLSHKKDLILLTDASSKTSLTSSSKISRKKSAEIINLDDTSMVDNDVDPMLSSLGSEKSADISNVVNIDPMMPSKKEKSAVSVFVPNGCEKSADIINIDAMMTSHKNLNESFSMSIDDEYDNLPLSPAGGHYFPLQSPKQVTEKEKSYYITSEEFNYTMNLLNLKVSALYKLCRYISDQQQENSKSLEKLVALDELSDYFWNVSYLMYLEV